MVVKIVFMCVFLQKTAKINHLVSLSNGHGKIKLYFLSTKKKEVVKKKNVTRISRVTVSSVEPGTRSVLKMV